MLFSSFLPWAFAGVEGSISGVIRDEQGVAVSNAQVVLQSLDGRTLKTVQTSATGEYQFFPVEFGDYKIEVKGPSSASTTEEVHVASGGVSQADLQLASAPQSKEMVVEVKAKRRLVQNSAPVSSVEISHEMIQKLPQGDQVRLPTLIANTTPGVVPGAFGQMFIRGNHANIQYQIDGVQMPESPSNTFGEAFSPRNIDHMEVITGGIPAEYGERLSAVVNIVTKSGTETPGGNVELNYGTYNRFSPQLSYGGSNESGDLHYFFSANYFRTDRGLDTPQPVSDTDITQGDRNPVHDAANGNNQFVRVDWLADNNNKLTLTFFNSYNFFQIPNFPGSFSPSDSIFNTDDQFGNSPLNYTPATTDDNQTEINDYIQAVWKHTYSPQTFLQLAPYWKYSYINVNNDLANDLSPLNPNYNNAASFTENRHVNNIGLKGDLTTRVNDRNLIKTGFQVQASQAIGTVGVFTATESSTNSDPNSGYFENVYVQDEFTIAKPLVLNAGIRFSATQFDFSGLTPTDYLFQPRIGLNYMVTDTTKLHVFYGKLFQPAPLENLRLTYNNLFPGQGLQPYDVKAEKDDYYEVGISQQFAETQLAALNVYYKDATNMLDDAQLLNTPIAQPYNYAEGYAYGLELSVRGKITEDWSEFANYSYGIAKGRGLSGGVFAFQPGQGPGTDYQFLDHVQLHTFNSGVTYMKNYFWSTVQGLYGSGLRTGPQNSLSLPGHFTMNFTFGYEFHGQSWFSKWRTSLDILNAFDNAYPITIANGFNGSHYAAGREFFFRLSKEL